MDRMAAALSAFTCIGPIPLSRLILRSPCRAWSTKRTLHLHLHLQIKRKTDEKYKARNESRGNAYEIEWPILTQGETDETDSKTTLAERPLTQQMPSDRGQKKPARKNPWREKFAGNLVGTLVRAPRGEKPILRGFTESKTDDLTKE